jgi:hypothetical protein
VSGDDVWDDAFATAAARIEPATAPQLSSLLLTLALTGATVAREVYEVFRPLFRSYGPLSLVRAADFTSVFSMSLAARWVHNTWPSSEEARRFEYAVEVIDLTLHLFGDLTQHRRRQSAFLARQFMHERDAQLAGSGPGSLGPSLFVR